MGCFSSKDVNAMPSPQDELHSSAAKIALKFNKESKIIIIGAGPAGIHMASELIKEGYTNIEILEKTSRSGGKSYTITDSDGVPHEMGTCYMHPQYTFIRELIKEYNPENEEVEITTGVLSERIRTDENVEKKEQVPIKLGDFITNETEFRFIDQRWHWINDIITGGIPVLDGVRKYELAYNKVFGYDQKHLEVGFGYLPKPKNMELINMNFLDFLRKNDCLELVPTLLYSSVTQGYGLLDEISAFYGLLWNRPDLLKSMINPIDIIKREIHNKLVQPMLKNGFNELWDKIIEKRDIKIKHNINITSINRNIGNDKQIEINYKVINADGDDEKEENLIKCDVLFIAMNQKFALPLYDATDEETKIFNDLEAYTLCTTLYESDIEHQELSPLNFHGEFWPDTILKADGGLMAHRQCVRVVRPELVGKLATDMNVAYQFFNTEPKGGMLGEENEQNDAVETLEKELEIWGETGVKIHKQLYWSYFAKWNHKDIMAEYPWIVRDELQGKIKNTFYIGSSVCFESVLHVVSYNRELLVQLGIH